LFKVHSKKIMEKVYSHPPWWGYFVSIGFIVLGIYILKLWKKYRNPQATIVEKATTEWNYLIAGVAAIVGGITFLIIDIYQACTGWVAK